MQLARSSGCLFSVPWNLADNDRSLVLIRFCDGPPAKFVSLVAENRLLPSWDWDWQEIKQGTFRLIFCRMYSMIVGLVIVRCMIVGCVIVGCVIVGCVIVGCVIVGCTRTVEPKDLLILQDLSLYDTFVKISLCSWKSHLEINTCKILWCNIKKSYCYTIDPLVLENKPTMNVQYSTHVSYDATRCIWTNLLLKQHKSLVLRINITVLLDKSYDTAGYAVIICY